MNDRRIKLGFSITEVLVVVAIIAVLVGIGVPAAKQMQKSFESTAGVKNAISAVLGNARAIALKEGKYAGVRFQQDAAGRQYMVLVIHDPAKLTAAELAADPYATGTDLANGFRAVKGRKPLPLPENVGVMDLQINAGSTTEESQLRDTTTFSIVFSSAGKLVTHNVRVRNRHGKATGDNVSKDNVFNTKNNVVSGKALFYQDDYVDDGLFEEASRKFFVIYEKNAFAKVDWAQWNVYLSGLEKVYINPYSGEIIK